FALVLFSLANLVLARSQIGQLLQWQPLSPRRSAAWRGRSPSAVPMPKPSPATVTPATRTRREKCRTRDSGNLPQPLRMLYLRPPGFSGTALQFHAFDAPYVENLRAGDLRTQEHFVGYFTELLHLKLRSRLQSPQAIEDVRQETFARVIAGLRKPGALRQPESLGAFVNTVCNNVLFEHYRASSRSQSLDEENAQELPSKAADAHSMAVASQIKVK